jgi:hypothetical protein
VRSDDVFKIAETILFTKFRYWNDPEVLQKIGQAMGVNLPGESSASTVLSGPEETEEEGGYDDESIVHHTASVGDAEVMD